MTGLNIFIDLTIVTLLIATIAFAVVLNRRLTTWRQDRTEFERLIADFNRAATQAETGIERLKAASEQTGKTLQQAVTKGQSLRDDLAYLIERAEPLTDRLTEGVRSARSIRREDAPFSTASPPAQKAKEAERGSEDEDNDERARAKRELLRALAALR